MCIKSEKNQINKKVFLYVHKIREQMNKQNVLFAVLQKDEKCNATWLLLGFNLQKKCKWDFTQHSLKYINIFTHVIYFWCSKYCDILQEPVRSVDND